MVQIYNFFSFLKNILQKAIKNTQFCQKMLFQKQNTSFDNSMNINIFLQLTFAVVIQKTNTFQYF